MVCVMLFQSVYLFLLKILGDLKFSTCTLSLKFRLFYNIDVQNIQLHFLASILNFGEYMIGFMNSPLPEISSVRTCDI